MSDAVSIVAASPADLPEIQSIYAHHVLNGTGTFETVPPSVEELRRAFENATGRGWAWLVARDATGVLGYAHFSQFRPRRAYRYTVEDSVYVRDDVRGQGVGKALVGRLVEEATAAGFRQMLALIGDAENIGSVGVHLSLGFRRIGTLHAAGWKFDRWLDVVMMQRQLGRGDVGEPI